MRTEELRATKSAVFLNFDFVFTGNSKNFAGYQGILLDKLGFVPGPRHSSYLSALLQKNGEQYDRKKKNNNKHCFFIVISAGKI